MAIVHRWSPGQTKASLTGKMFIRGQAEDAISGGLGEPELTSLGLVEPAPTRLMAPSRP